ncbi:zinc ribbon domain-containing protein [Candidatus Woesearchaeota archaeon]|nr:zinc ribbon domain-containing protein [Candidatus Woesearchaeota archaeon]
MKKMDKLRATLEEFGSALIYTFQCMECGKWFAKADPFPASCPECSQLVEVNDSIRIKNYVKPIHKTKGS